VAKLKPITEIKNTAYNTYIPIPKKIISNHFMLLKFIDLHVENYFKNLFKNFVDVNKLFDLC